MIYPFMEMQSIFCGAKSEEKLVKASRDMYDCVYIFVSSTNTAFRMLNQFLGSKLATITVQENLSIKEIFQLLQSALKEMQMLVELKDKDFQEKIEVPLYSKLILPDLSTNEKIRLIKDIYGQYNGIFENICGPICAVIIKHGNLPEMLETAIQNLMSTPVPSLQVSELLMTKEEIAKALPDSSPCSSQTASPVKQKTHSFSVVPSSFSLTKFMRIIHCKQTSKDSVQLAAELMAEAVQILKPTCEHFQRSIKMAEEYITLIIDKKQ
ncbi:uncharacterized protein LOC120312854 [Crotalus tigris]|uniref:uncharacterized protein LOC120312854 n=1 Tax=Crotalus tigris TaxID=88082 RepID=UPI00192FB10D|nr:uncharacterized protein LOC120312854 [Crotalus tigris]XP_039210078.1 uncharacterized protein LOC120312854 [Crotalus tigris]XP_039210079.1 uncharacterized protein LOC120312854 [Crotalus tigris]XP_039210080.1 uncharacterized protein LOC120312854 [Crotalus tigris]XP_039210081.1 uncharacterized protein LOC120312854 [Crotalus tigris]